MKKISLSQEGLKLIACITMLIDHIGAVLVPQIGLRMIGRLAFPIYCFLLSEGTYYTRNRKEYGLRLLVGMVLAEIPFDLLFFGRLTFAHQSVMVTLMLGYLYAMTMNYVPQIGQRILMLLPFAFGAELLGCDYGGWGVAMIGMFIMTRTSKHKWLNRALWLSVISWMIGGYEIAMGPLSVPVQLFAVLALIPISLYDGHKQTDNIWVRRGFYLFYPAHLMVLYLIQ